MIQPDYHSPPRQYQPLERNEAKGNEAKDNDGTGKWQLNKNVVINKYFKSSK